MAFRNTKGQLAYGLPLALIFVLFLRYCGGG